MKVEADKVDWVVLAVFEDMEVITDIIYVDYLQNHMYGLMKLTLHITNDYFTAALTQKLCYMLSYDK